MWCVHKTDFFFFFFSQHFSVSPFCTTCCPIPICQLLSRKFRAVLQTDKAWYLPTAFDNLLRWINHSHYLLITSHYLSWQKISHYIFISRAKRIVGNSTQLTTAAKTSTTSRQAVLHFCVTRGTRSSTWTASSPLSCHVAQCELEMC